MNTKQFRPSNAIVLLLVLVWSLTATAPAVQAANLMPDEIRAGSVIAKFDDTRQYAIAYKPGF